MIAQTFQDTFSPEWIKTHLSNPTHDLIILRHIIPWQPIIDRLVPLYNLKKGRTGYSLRTMVASAPSKARLCQPEADSGPESLGQASGTECCVVVGNASGEAYTGR